MVEYKSILKQNKDYEELYQEYNRVLNEKRIELVKSNNEFIQKIDLNELDSDELKELIETFKYNLDEKYKEKLKEAYCIKKPFENKVVEKMDFLSYKQKLTLDEKLSYFKNKHINYSFWMRVTLDYFIREKIIDVLISENMVRIDKELRCPNCSDYVRVLKEEDISLIKEFDSLKSMIKDYEKLDSDEYSEKLDRLYDRYYDILENHNVLYKYCDSCDSELEFEDGSELFKYCKDVYFLL